MEQDEAYRQLVKTHLVRPLIRYGAHLLGKSDEKVSASDTDVAHSFLSYIEAVGSNVKSFTRKNGEVV